MGYKEKTMRKFRLNQRRVAIICAVILVGLSTVTVLRQKGVLFDAKQNDSANTHVEPAKKTNTAAPQPKQKVEPATDRTQNSPVPQAKPEASAMPASEKKTDEPQLKQPKQTIETKQPAASTTAPTAEQKQAAQADGKKSAEKTSEKTADTGAAKKSSDAFTYTASAGSSYTLFAREAISSVVANQQLQASTTQTLQAEVELTNNAGSPLLNVGQAVTISRADVIAALQHTGVKAATQNASTNSAAESRESDKSKENAPAKNTQQTQAATTSADYNATASPGDSYTFHARTAIAKYLQTNKRTLSPEQRVAAESYVTVAAGSPSLEIGQTVTITTKTIADAVSRASSLSTDEQAAWAQWATL